MKPVAVSLLRSSLTEFGRAAAGVSAGADAGAGADVDVGPQRPLASGESLEQVGRCRLTVSKPALKAPVVSARETRIS